MNTLAIYHSSNTVYLDTGSYSKEYSLSKLETKNNLYIVTCKLSNNINVVLTLPVQLTTLIEIGGSGSGVINGSGGVDGGVTDNTNNDNESGDNQWDVGNSGLKDQV